MPVRDRRPEDERPLFRAINEQQLVRTVGEEQEEAEQEEPRGAAEEQAAPQAGASQEEKGPIARALDKAQENNWVYDSVANTARQKGLADKADGLLSRLTGR